MEEKIIKRKLIHANYDIKMTRRAVGYTSLDYENNFDVMKKLNTQPIMELLENYRCNWKSTVFSNAQMKNLIPNSLLTAKREKDLREEPSDAGL
jgi:hypothetical protein